MDTNTGNNMGAPAAQRAMKAIYAVNERGGRSFWTRVGVGFENRDGSLTIKLDAIPVNGTLQVREWEPERQARDAAGGEGRPSPRRRDEAVA